MNLPIAADPTEISFIGGEQVLCHQLLYQICKCIINSMTKTFTEISQILKDQKPLLINKYGVYVIGMFGSYVHNQQRPDSDVDILIALERPARISLIDLVELEADLSDLLGVKVDLVIKDNLRKRIGKKILEEVIPL
jgi:predicted nucleotidyltransferase